MLREVTTVEVEPSGDAEALLHDAFTRRSLAPPRLDTVEADEIPEPFQSLLVHESDMTSTLQRYHGDRLLLRQLHCECSNDIVYREVLLCRESTGQPVEYGVIRIALNAFSAEARKAIEEGKIPLGQILDDFQVEYDSRPRRFFQISNEPYIEEQLADSGISTRYGRINRLATPAGERLAEVVEILPGRRFDNHS